MDTEEMFNAVRDGTVTFEEFQDWVHERETDHQSFCANELSMYIGD